MSDDADARLRHVVAAAHEAEPAGAVCRASATALAVAGASLTVMHEGALAPLGWSSGLALRLEDLQQLLGEGPSLDAHRAGRGVAEPALAGPGRRRWVAFAPAALAAGAAALFSFPLRVGAVRVGALTLHQTIAGDLSARQHMDAQTVAEVAVSAILAAQAGAPPGSLGRDLETLVAYNATVHQASGVLSAQLGIGVGEAIVRLRAHAFANDRALAEVAADVVAHRLLLPE